MEQSNFIAFLRRYKYAFIFLFLANFAIAGSFDNLGFNGNTISSRDINGNIILSPNGTGKAIFNYGTTNTVPYFDSSKDLISSAVTPTELGYLSGVTSAIQTQLNSVFLNPMTILGDIIYENATPEPTRLAGNTSTTKKYLSQTGTGSASAAPAWTQPACADLSDSVTSCSTDTTNASNISSGTLGAARLPTPTSSTLGGVKSYSAVTNQWINAISTAGLPSSTQPDFSNLSGNATVAQGGTGQTSLTAYALMAAGTTSTGNMQQISGLGTTGQSLISNGASTLPSWQNSVAGYYSKNYLNLLITSNGTNTGNGNFELGTTTGWSLGHVTLTSGFPSSNSPTFGSGSSGNLSLSTVTSGSQLSGTYSGSYISSAATTAGDFVATNAFNIDNQDQGKVLTFKLYYKAQTGGTTATWTGTSSNSFGVAIWDVTNSLWIQPAGTFSITQSSGVGYSTGTFQTTSNSTQYRLIFYNANATTGAITLYLDDFSVGPQTAPFGPAVTDWQDFPSLAYGTLWSATGTAATYGTVVTHRAQYRRVGANMEIREDFVNSTGGTAGTGALLFSLPAGYTIDTTKAPGNTTIAANSTSVTAGVGSFSLIDGTAIQVQGGVQVYDSTHLKIMNLTATSAAGGAGGGYFGGGGYISFSAGSTAFSLFATVPISGWSSNVQMSNDTDTRVVAAFASLPSAFTSSTTIPVNFTTIAYDTHSAITTSATAWKYTAPVTGIYTVQSYTGSISTSTMLYKNGSAYAVLAYNQGAYIIVSPIDISLNAGDFIDVRTSGSQSVPGGTLSAVGTTSYFSIRRQSGPSVIAATESVAARAHISTGASTTAGNPFNFDTVDFDTHGGISTGTTTWKYTVPVSGYYRVSSNIFASNVTFNFSLYKNATAFSFLGASSFATSVIDAPGSAGSTTVPCNLGDILTIVGSATITPAAVGSLTTAQSNWISIEKIK